MTRGLSFLGHETFAVPTFYLDFEGGILTQEREARLCAGLGYARTDLPLQFARANTSLCDGMVEALLEHIEKQGIRAVFVDTLSSCLPSDANLNESTTRGWLGKLSRISDLTGALVVLVAHQTKGSSTSLSALSGHSTLAGGVQASIALSRSNDTDPHVIEVSCARAAKRGFAPFRVRWSDTPCASAPEGTALVAERLANANANASANTPRTNTSTAHQHAAAVRVAGERIMRAIYASPTRNASRRALLDAAGGNRTAAKEALARLTDARVIYELSSMVELHDRSIEIGEQPIANALGSTGGFQR
jgi:hypothetical protein